MLYLRYAFRALINSPVRWRCTSSEPRSDSDLWIIIMYCSKATDWTLSVCGWVGGWEGVGGDPKFYNESCLWYTLIVVCFQAAKGYRDFKDLPLGVLCTEIISLCHLKGIRYHRNWSLWHKTCGWEITFNNTFDEDNNDATGYQERWTEEKISWRFPRSSPRRLSTPRPAV